jgi:hypothetical protein
MALRPRSGEIGQLVLSARPLSFSSLDGLVFAAERGRLNGRTPARMTAVSLGPLIEMAHLARTGILPPPDKTDWLALDGLAFLYRAVLGGRLQWVCPDGHRIGFLRTRRDRTDDGKELLGFCLAVRQAAALAGFPPRIAQQLAAAIQELHDNIYDHSGAPGTGLIAFRAGVSSFEFVVSDRGVGILETLRSCPAYSHVADHGNALMLALAEGVSRYGPNTGHGFGFRPIFNGLANLRGLLRFRSGEDLRCSGPVPRPSRATACHFDKMYRP